jgi:hypothetical protein
MSKNTQTSGLVNYIAHSGSIVSVSGSLTVTGSLNVTGGMTGSFQGVATTASYVLNAVSASFATTASYAVSASVATNAVTASYALNAVSASFATTAVTSSFANAFTVAGTLTAQTLVVQTITSSVLYSSGSNIFGNALSNTQVMTGSVGITGSLAVAGTGAFSGNVTLNAYGNQLKIGSNGGTDGFIGIGSTQSTMFIGDYSSGTKGLTINTATGSATFSNSVTSTSLIVASSLDGDPSLATFTNANAGTSAEAAIYVRNGATANDATFVQAVGTGFTTTGGFVQDGGIVGTGTGLSGGMSLMVRANADMRFYTNGHTNQRMIITSGGDVAINTTTITNPNSLNKVLVIAAAAPVGFVLFDSRDASPIGLENRGAVFYLTYGTSNILVADGASGKVGIGTASPGGKLDIRDAGTTIPALGSTGTGLNIRRTDGAIGLMIGYENAGGGSYIQSQHMNASAVSYPLLLQPNGGNVLVGRTTSGLTNTSGTTISGGSIQVEEASYVFYGNRTTTDGLFMGIRRNNVDVGSISVTTSATAFNTSSDYRLKTDFKEFNALSIIDSITTYDFAWKIDNTRAYGVKAHELQNILPYVVFGEKDEINEDDSIKPQAVDYSKLVPVLVKAIQELQTRITQLENK